MVSAVSSLFVWQPDLVSAKDVYEGAWLPDFTVWEGNGWGFPAFQRKSYGFGYEDVPVLSV